MFFNDDSKEKQLHIRVTSKEKQEIKNFAEKEGLTLSKFILKCIDYYIKNLGN